MTDAALFPPTPAEHLAALASFIGQEIGHRQHMLWQHPERESYWRGRVDQAKQALARVEALREAMG